MVFKSSLNNNSGGGGVSSLNSLTGALSLTSSDSSVTITPSGSTINLQVVGDDVVTPFQEVPSGTVNGSNVTFTLAHTPASPSGVILSLDGITQFNGTDFTVSGSTITFVTAPATNSLPWAIYNTQSSFANANTPQALAFSSSIAWNINNGTNVTITATSNTNFTLNNPTNLVAGAGGMITIKQFSTGGQVITWGSGYRGPAGSKFVLSTGNNAIDEIAWYSPDGTHIDINGLAAFS